MQSFTLLIDTVRDRLYRLALRMTGDGGEAEDVVQEVIISGWRREAEITQLDNPPARLLKMTHNRAIDHLRSRKSRVANETAAAPSDRCEQTPHRLTESADTLAYIHRLMMRLPDRQRSVLQLREVEDMSYREIAEVTGMSMEQVKVYLHRGRQQLRQWLVNENIVDK